MVEGVANGLLVMTAFASWCVYDAPLVHQMSMQSSGVVDNGPLASGNVK